MNFIFLSVLSSGNSYKHANLSTIHPNAHLCNTFVDISVPMTHLGNWQVQQWTCEYNKSCLDLSEVLTHC